MFSELYLFESLGAGTHPQLTDTTDYLCHIPWLGPSMAFSPTLCLATHAHIFLLKRLVLSHGMLIRACCTGWLPFYFRAFGEIARKKPFGNTAQLWLLFGLRASSPPLVLSQFHGPWEQWSNNKIQQTQLCSLQGSLLPSQQPLSCVAFTCLLDFPPVSQVWMSI